MATSWLNRLLKKSRTVRDSTFTGNSALRGGALENRGTATVSGSTFTDNAAGSATAASTTNRARC